MKNKKLSNHEKLFNRLTKIMQRLYDGEVLIPSRLAMEFNCSVRTIQRDFSQRLRENFPIEEVTDGYGWKLIEGQTLKKTNIQREKIVLDIIENISKNLGTEIFSQSKPLLSKLKEDEESAFYTKLLFEDMGKRFEDLEKLETAIKKRVIISFIHDNKEKFLKPYKILNLDGYWYICGINVKTNRLTNIKISKTKAISLTTKKFEIETSIDEKVKCAITGHFKPSWKLQNVELLIEEDPKIILKQIPISHTLKVLDMSDNDGWVHVSLEVTDLNEIMPYIKKNIPKVYVLSPDVKRTAKMGS